MNTPTHSTHCFSPIIYVLVACFTILTALTVNAAPAAPVITTQPTNQVATAGQNAIFTVVANGDPAPVYQWQSAPPSSITWTDIPDATAATLTLNAVNVTMNSMQYHCVVTNTQGAATSKTATLAVHGTPVITTQPVNQTVVAGDTAAFSITAVGFPTLNYQWQQCLATGSAWTNYTTGALRITGVTTAMNGRQYRCIVSNQDGSVTSDPATLTVTTPAKPVITLQPMIQSVTAGQTATFTVSATGNPAPSYQWQSAFAGSSYWSNISDAYTSPGAITSTLTLTDVTLAMSGMQYRCLAGNSQGSATSNPATLIVTPDMALLAAAQQLKTQLESSGTTTITVTGSTDLSLVNGSTLAPGKTIVGADATATIAGNFDIPASAIILGVNFTGGVFTIYGADVEITHCTFTDALIIIRVSDNITFSWDKFTATAFGSDFAGMSINTNDAPTGILLHHNFWGDGLRSSMPSVIGARVLMYNNVFTQNPPLGNADATSAWTGAQILSQRNIYQGINNPLTKQTNPGALTSGLLRTIDNFMDSDSGTIAPGTDKVFVPAYSYLMHSVGLGTPGAADLYQLVATYAGNTAGANSITPATPNDSASISATVIGDGATATAIGANVPVGGGFTLTANTTGFTPVSRQWYRDNFAIIGETAVTYNMTNASAAASAGAYSVELTTPDGAIVSSGAFTVTVGAPVITTHPTSQTITIGSSATFSVEATGNTLTYQWQKNGTNITGATSASYTITNAQQSDSGSTYRVTVSNAAGTVTSNPATLTVNTSGGNTGGSGNNSGSNGGGGAPSLFYLAAAAALLAARRWERRVSTRQTARP